MAFLRPMLSCVTAPFAGAAFLLDMQYCIGLYFKQHIREDKIMLILHVTYEMKKDMAKPFLEELFKSGAVDKTRHERGNGMYHYFFPAEGEDRILLVEKWQDEECLSDHMNSAHMQEIRAIKEKYVEKTLLEKYEVK